MQITDQKKREFVNQRVQARRKQLEKERTRCQDEFQSLHNPSEMITWFRKTLQRKSIGEGRLVNAMDEARSGIMTFSNFQGGLCYLSIDLNMPSCQSLYEALGKEKRVVPVSEVRQLAFARRDPAPRPCTCERTGCVRLLSGCSSWRCYTQVAKSR